MRSDRHVQSFKRAVAHLLFFKYRVTNRAKNSYYIRSHYFEIPKLYCSCIQCVVARDINLTASPPVAILCNYNTSEHLNSYSLQSESVLEMLFWCLDS